MSTHAPMHQSTASAPPPVSSYSSYYAYAGAAGATHAHTSQGAAAGASTSNQQPAPVPSIHQPQHRQQHAHASYYAHNPYTAQQHGYAPYGGVPYGAPVHTATGPSPPSAPLFSHPHAHHFSPPVHGQYHSMPTPHMMPNAGTATMLTPQQQHAQQAATWQQQQQQQQRLQPPQHHGLLSSSPPLALTPQPPASSPLADPAILSTSAPTPSAMSAASAASAPPPAPPSSSLSLPAVPPSTSSTLPQSGVAPSLQSVLQDLDTRFLVNLPDEELASFERILFQLQQAHWFYLDFYSDKWSTLPKLGFKTFCEVYFKHIPSFRRHLSKFEQVYASFNAYLSAVPVCGVILVSPDQSHVLMVQSWGGKSWGFPRGKLDQHEDEIECAIRECTEEVGFDPRAWFKGYEIKPATGGIGGALSRQSSALSRQTSTSSTSSSALAALQPSFIECHTAEKVTRLYILLNVPFDTQFETRTRKEIGKIEWVPLAALPGFTGKSGGKQQGPPPPEPTGNPLVDMQKQAAYAAAQQAAGNGNASSTKYKFGNAIPAFAAKLKTFLKKLKAGQITGYGRYEAPLQSSNAQQAPQNQQPASGNKKKAQADGSKSARKVAPAQQQPQPQQHVPSSAAPRRSNSATHKSAAAAADECNQDTFAGGAGGSGWSVEAMYAANANLGVVSTVVEEKVQLPAHLDAILNKALGRAPQQQTPQAQQQGLAPQQKAGKKGKKGAGAAPAPAPAATSPTDVSHSVSAPISIPGAAPAASSSSKPAPPKQAHVHVPAPELDFGHNPYVSFANMNLHQQANGVAPVQQQQQQQAQQQTQQQQQQQGRGSVKPGKKSKGAASAAAGAAPAAVAGASLSASPQIRILKRPTSAAAGATAPAAAASSAPAPAAAEDASSDFRFDVNAIMQPFM